MLTKRSQWTQCADAAQNAFTTRNFTEMLPQVQARLELLKEKEERRVQPESDRANLRLQTDEAAERRRDVRRREHEEDPAGREKRRRTDDTNETHTEAQIDDQPDENKEEDTGMRKNEEGAQQGTTTADTPQCV